LLLLSTGDCVIIIITEHRKSDPVLYGRVTAFPLLRLSSAGWKKARLFRRFAGPLLLRTEAGRLPGRQGDCGVSSGRQGLCPYCPSHSGPFILLFRGSGKTVAYRVAG
jgi:hypothetical protein